MKQMSQGLRGKYSSVVLITTLKRNRLKRYAHEKPLRFQLAGLGGLLPHIFFLFLFSHMYLLFKAELLGTIFPLTSLLSYKT